MIANVLGREFVVTQAFGCTDYAGEWIAPWCPAGHFHAGIDLGNDGQLGDPIYASRSGVVVALGPWDVSGTHQYLGPYAPVVKTAPVGGLFMEYGHVRRSLVKVGDQVAAGQQIAEMGDLGAAVGVHLHLEVRRDGPYQGVAEQAANVLDPSDFVAWSPELPAPPAQTEEEEMIAAVEISDGTVLVFVKGTDSALWVKHLDPHSVPLEAAGSTQQFQSLGGQLA